jgi:hypothetical protein
MDKKERFITKNKAAFKKRYGADWERVLYSTANKMFKEEHGAGDWGTDKLTTKYLKDTPGQEDAIVKSKKIVLKKKSVEEESPSEKNRRLMNARADAADRKKQEKRDKQDRQARAINALGNRKDRGAFWKREKSVGESVEITESDKAEYNKLMDKYGDMPMSKVPMKARLRIRELGRSVRGDKGGPTAGDLVKSMKRRRMGEEVEQVDESLGNFMVDYDGKEMKVRAKDEEDARSRVGRRLKIPKSKQQKIVVWEPMTDAERRDFELDDDGEREYANRYGHDMARKTDRLKQRAKKRAGRRKQRNEDVEVAEAGMIGRTKPSRELNVQKDEKPHLAGVKSLKYQKRAAHKAERKKGKADVKINPELDETVERAKRGVDMAKQRVLAAKQRVARAKARDLGQKRRDMRNEDSEIEEGGMSGRDFAQAGRSADYKSRVTGTQQRYAANRAKRSARATEKHSDVMRRRAIARARSRMRK